MEFCLAARCLPLRDLRGRAHQGRPQDRSAPPKADQIVADVQATCEAGERTCGWALRAAVQLARWALQRDLFVGIPAPQLPVPGVQVRGNGDFGLSPLNRILRWCPLSILPPAIRYGWHPESPLFKRLFQSK